MSERKDDLSRRDFLRGAAGVVLAGASGPAALGSAGQEAQAQPDEKKPAPEETPAAAAPPRKRARVVLIRDEKVLGENRAVNAEVISRMLDDGVAALLQAPSAEEAFARLIKPGDTVGIKSNAWRFLATPPELEAAIKKRVAGAGVPEERIGIDDREVLENPIFKEATALINVRPLRTHHWSGVGSLIKNYVMFSPAPWTWHDDSCADLAGLWDLPEVKGKTRLNILVMLTPLFHGKGPHHFNAQYTWEYKGLIISADPVAADATGVRIFEAKRKEFFGAGEPFTVPPKHIQVAETKFGLGVADPERIDLVKLGWMEGVLI